MARNRRLRLKPNTWIGETLAISSMRKFDYVDRWMTEDDKQAIACISG